MTAYLHRVSRAIAPTWAVYELVAWLGGVHWMSHLGHTWGHTLAL